MRRVAVIVAGVVLAAVLIGAMVVRTQDKRLMERDEFLMGTLIQAKAYGRYAPRAFDELFARLREIEARMTINAPGSEVGAVSDSSGKAPVKVSPDTFYVIQKALHYAALTGGRFDPTVAPVVSLWHIGFPDARVPSPAEIASAVKRVSYRNVVLDPAEKTVYLTGKGMGLDLGAIAKGYAADEAISIFKKQRVSSALISLGGNVSSLGTKVDGNPWRIGIQDPLETRSTYMATLETSGETLVTSGGYERFLEVDGKRYHHILDPDTGYPAETDLLSSTIIAGTSIDADALSTGTFILGREKALELLEGLPGVQAILIDKDRRVWVTSGLRGRLQIVNDSYSMAP